MSTVRGHVSIYTLRKARKRYRCDHDGHHSWASPLYIEPGDDYFRASLPPHSEIGNEHWWTMRLCWGCAPVELTTTIIAKAPEGVPF